ncbi:MAG TPA: helix-turn-helix domain-containing protein [Phycisphaerales bacterium]|nr:helix-turn-helix domain-containing protein [Phycisphaerales bacterium]
MAKMFYSLEEAAQRLGKTQSEVQQMASSGQLQEFKDRDKLMFKREQVDLLAGGGKGDSAGFIPLAGNEGSSMGLQLDDSGSKAGSKGGSGHIELDDPASKEKSGISIFDTEGTEEGDPSAVTRITETRGADDITLESVGSGSGLLDLTREADDTSLGADLLEDVYKPDEDGAGGSQTQGSSGLFESTAAPSDVAAAAAAGMGGIGMVAAEPYDGAGSGWAGGAALVATIVIAVTLVTVLLGLMGADNPIAAMVGPSALIYAGIGLVVLIIFAVVGGFLGKRTG